MLEQSKIEDLVESMKSYYNTNYEMRKLETIQHISEIGASFGSVLLIGLVLIFFILFFSIVAGFYFAVLFGNNYAGFAIVAGFYLLIGIILFFGRKKLLEKPFRDKIVRKTLSKN